MKFLIISIGWLALCALAIRWALPRLDASEKELDHEEAILMNEEWDEEGYPIGLPPILNQSERWQERARKAESLGFLDSFEDEPKRSA